MKIFITDDDAMLRMIIADQLGEDARTIREFNNAQDLLDAMDENPELLLLDVEMPGIDGLEVCRSWRTAGNTTTQIIFISSHEEFETLLAAYEAGGNDYITKPITGAVLQCKVLMAEAAASQHQEWSADNQLLEEIPEHGDHLSFADEISITQQYLHQAFTAKSIDQVVKALFTAMGRLGVTGLVEVRDEFSSHRFSPQGQCTGLEASLLKHAQQLGAEYQLEKYLVLNMPVVTLLLTQPTETDAAEKARVCQDLKLLAESANTRIRSLSSEQHCSSHLAADGQQLRTIAESFYELLQGYNRSRHSSHALIEEFLNDQRAFIQQLTIADQQKKQICTQIDWLRSKLAELSTADSQAYQQLQDSIQQLNDLMNDPALQSEQQF